MRNLFVLFISLSIVCFSEIAQAYSCELIFQTDLKPVTKKIEALHLYKLYKTNVIGFYKGKAIDFEIILVPLIGIGHLSLCMSRY